MDKACHNFEHEIIRELLLSSPLNFQPTDQIGDLVWKAKKENVYRHTDKMPRNIDFLPSGQIVH